MAVDLKKLNQNQLNDLITKAEQRKVELEKEKVSKVREKVAKLLKDEGFTFEEVFGGRTTPCPSQHRQRAAEVPQSGRSGADLVRPRQAPALVQCRAEGRQEGKGPADQVILDPNVSDTRKAPNAFGVFFCVRDFRAKAIAAGD